ncbi:MAG: nucleoside triphosphate pyrophosphohydrolase [Nitrospinae bacterium]|nr:nucleoside triphosphate pyrophosphohydrolase [Nitrospinota bacterium]
MEDREKKIDSEKRSHFDKLVDIMERLRGQEGCPWDLEQTRESLKPFLIEETYEVLEAIDEDNPEKIKEELGDLLYQIIFYARIASERGEFDIYDVIDKIHDKMIRRHPHVFKEEKIDDSKKVLKRWEEIKRKEKNNIGRRSVLDGIPKELPSLLRAQILQEKASRVGFDWEHIDQVFEKVEEEMEEFRKAFSQKNTKEMENEIGDLLFALVNIARFIEVNPEDALRKTLSRFIKRFRYIEEEIAKEGRDIKEVSLEEMDSIWERAKAGEREEV